MSKLEQAYRQMVAEENEAPDEDIMEAPRKADKSGGESSGLKNDAEDLRPANVDPEGTSPAAKADDKVKKDKGRKADKKVKADAMGAVKEDEEEDNELLALIKEQAAILMAKRAEELAAVLPKYGSKKKEVK